MRNISIKNVKSQVDFLANVIDFVSILSCPDDGSSLNLQKDALICNSCNRKFIIKENFIDLRPRERLLLNEKGVVESAYDSYYDTLMQNGDPGKFGTFGLISNSVPPGFVNETISHLQKYVRTEQIVCDIGAGSGDYSVEMARKCKIIFHCDLDMSGITLAQEKAKDIGITNIFFLMCDYFRLPFKQRTIDFAYTIDIIERGSKHDRQLLSEIVRIIKKESLVAFDCHSKERSSLTRINPQTISTYSKTEILDFTKEFSLRIMNISGTGFLPQIKRWSIFEYRILNFMSRFLLFPPARWFVICNSIDS